MSFVSSFTRLDRICDIDSSKRGLTTKLGIDVINAVHLPPQEYKDLCFFFQIFYT